MPQKKGNSPSIDINDRRCRHCSHCIQLCPSRAIKVEKHRLKIIPERCIMCGACIRGCPQHALGYQSGLDRVKALIAGGAKTIACLDPSFPAVFDTTGPRQLVTGLKALGFTEVWEGAFGVELVSHAYKGLLRDRKRQTCISSFCPVLVFYIQKYHPKLISHLAPIVSPMIACGRIVRQKKGPEWKVIYLTSCLAHTAEMVAPEVAGAIDEVVSLREMREWIGKAGINPAELTDTEFDGPRPYLGRVVPVIGGLYRSMGEVFDVLDDEITVVGGHRRSLGSLNLVASGAIKATFLDFVFCQGCIDGPFVGPALSVLGRRQMVVRYTKAEMAQQDRREVDKEIEEYEDIDLRRTFTNMEQPLPVPSEEQIKEVLGHLGKVAPNRNLDCRACGYPTCRDKAIAVVQGITDAEYCLPYLLEQSKKIYQDLETSHRQLQLSHKELGQAQAQLIRTEKLAALGQLSAGVAHEINNPLGTITIYAHLLLRSLEPDDPRREDVELIVSEANRTKEIVQGLLNFARETKLRSGPTNVNDVVEDVLGLVAQQSLFHNIKMKKVLDPNLPTIVADYALLKQVFLNIILNAAQAMEGNGKLAIITAAEKKQIKIKIQDTGPGIPPEVLGKLFSPFFTTKEKGTGLGLAISYGIIERHRGKIDVETDLGKGATFIISLPTFAEEEPTEDATARKFPPQNTNVGRKNYG
jgi:signal transduction histidine kinase/iron only hydrogenase large subunit-like protein